MLNNTLKPVPPPHVAERRNSKEPLNPKPNPSASLQGSEGSEHEAKREDLDSARTKEPSIIGLEHLYVAAGAPLPPKGQIFNPNGESKVIFGLSRVYQSLRVHALHIQKHAQSLYYKC